MGRPGHPRGSVSEALLERVRGLVGDAAAAEIDVAGRRPAVVARPDSDDAVAALLAAATQEGWRVEPAGRCAWLARGRPAPIDIVLSTARLDALHEYEPDDLTIGVGAGMTHGALRERVEPNGQQLPLDPPGGAGGSVAATVATACAGPLRAGLGTPRDHTLGLRLITGDGQTVDLGGRVVKNVAGYDLGKLVVGSFGSLGVITRLHLRLRPRPPVDRAVSLSSEDASALLDAIGALRDARVDLAAAELLDPALATALGFLRGWTLLLRLHGTAERVAALGDAIAEATSLEPEPVDGPVWSALDAAEAGAPVICRVARRPADLAETLATARELAREAGASDVLLAAHASDGIVRLLLAGTVPADRFAGAVNAARDAVAGPGGTVIVAQAPAPLLEAVDPFGPVGPTLNLMRGLKARFDPAGVLAPGRYVV